MKSFDLDPDVTVRNWVCSSFGISISVSAGSHFLRLDFQVVRSVEPVGKGHHVYGRHEIVGL